MKKKKKWNYLDLSDAWVISEECDQAFQQVKLFIFKAAAVLEIKAASECDSTKR